MSIVFVQNTIVTATATSKVMAFTTATVAGNTLVVAITHTATGTITVSDATSNTWVLAGSSANATPTAATGGYQVDIWYCLSALSVSSVTVTNNASQSGVLLGYLSEYSGIGAFGAVKVGYSATITKTPAPQTISYAQNALLYSAVAFVGTSQTVTVVGADVLEATASSGTNYMATAEQITNTSGSSGAAFTLNAASAWGQVVIAFSAASGLSADYLNNSYGITDISSYNHVINFGFTPTPGNFMFVFAASAISFNNVTGWGQVVNNGSNGYLDYFYCSASTGQTSITISESDQSYGIHPIAWAAYELPAGTTITSFGTSNNSNTTFPGLSGLPGTKQLVLAALSAPQESTISTGSATWVSPWTMDVSQYHSSYANSPISAGTFLTVAHQNNITATSYTPTGATFNFSGTQTAARQTIVIAFSVPTNNKSAYINNTYGMTDVSSYDHVINFGFTPTVGNFLIIIVASSMTLNIVSGWTRVTNNGNQADIGCFYTTATAGQTSITVTENLQSYGIHPVAWAAYELASGTTIANFVTASNSNTTFPTLSGLPGTNQLVMAAFGSSQQTTSSTSSVSWLSPWTMDISEFHSSYAAQPNSAGMFLTVAHQNNVMSTAITPSATFNSIGSQISESETFVIALTPPIPTANLIKISGSVPSRYLVGSSAVSAVYLGAVQVWTNVAATPTVVGTTQPVAQNYGANSGPSITTPSTTQVGDLMIITGYVEPANEGSSSVTYGTFTLPAGVILTSGFPIETDAAQINTGNDLRMYVWYQYATTTGSVTLSFSNSENIYWGIGSVTTRGGPTSGSPFADNPSKATISRSTTGVTTSPSVSLTLGGTNSLVLWLYCDWNGATVDSPVGYTVLSNTSNYPGQPAIASHAYSSAGNTGLVIASRSGNDSGMAAVLLSIRLP